MVDVGELVHVGRLLHDCAPRGDVALRCLNLHEQDHIGIRKRGGRGRRQRSSPCGAIDAACTLTVPSSLHAIKAAMTAVTISNPQTPATTGAQRVNDAREAATGSYNRATSGDETSIWPAASWSELPHDGFDRIVLGHCVITFLNIAERDPRASARWPVGTARSRRSPCRAGPHRTATRAPPAADTAVSPMCRERSGSRP